MEVTVTAYNSVHWQTEGNPTVTAWGDTLREGMRCIAVSRDLIPLGLDHDKEVVIEGLPGTFLVKDKMHRRFKRHIDLYMGEDVAGAREWGRKRRVIRFKVPLPADSLQIPETP
ncbi:3D domain-containing protein [Robiginitalea sp. SC105]|nr:3D domain-containing protein [Robiginitalea sp. SC105]